MLIRVVAEDLADFVDCERKVGGANFPISDPAPVSRPVGSAGSLRVDAMTLGSPEDSPICGQGIKDLFGENLVEIVEHNQNWRRDCFYLDE